MRKTMCVVCLDFQYPQAKTDSKAVLSELYLRKSIAQVTVIFFKSL